MANVGVTEIPAGGLSVVIFGESIRKVALDSGGLVTQSPVRVACAETQCCTKHDSD